MSVSNVENSGGSVELFWGGAVEFSFCLCFSVIAVISGVCCVGCLPFR